MYYFVKLKKHQKITTMNLYIGKKLITSWIQFQDMKKKI